MCPCQALKGPVHRTGLSKGCLSLGGWSSLTMTRGMCIGAIMPGAGELYCTRCRACTNCRKTFECKGIQAPGLPPGEPRKTFKTDACWTGFAIQVMPRRLHFPWSTTHGCVRLEAYTEGLLQAEVRLRHKQLQASQCRAYFGRAYRTNTMLRHMQRGPLVDL